MSETIRVEVAADESAFTPVRLVLGGLGTRLEFSVEQLEDLYLAVEHLFRAALKVEDAARFGVEMRARGRLAVVRRGSVQVDGAARGRRSPRRRTPPASTSAASCTPPATR